MFSPFVAIGRFPPPIARGIGRGQADGEGRWPVVLRGLPGPVPQTQMGRMFGTRRSMTRSSMRARARAPARLAILDGLTRPVNTIPVWPPDSQIRFFIVSACKEPPNPMRTRGRRSRRPKDAAFTHSVIIAERPPRKTSYAHPAPFGRHPGGRVLTVNESSPYEIALPAPCYKLTLMNEFNTEV